VKVHALAVGADDEDHLDGAVDGAEPVRGPGAELGCLAGLEDVLVLAQQQALRYIESPMDADEDLRDYRLPEVEELREAPEE
jgi:hypothetical protein